MLTTWPVPSDDEIKSYYVPPYGKNEDEKIYTDIGSSNNHDLNNKGSPSSLGVKNPGEQASRDQAYKESSDAASVTLSLLVAVPAVVLSLF
jgi:hypothetical protein